MNTLPRGLREPSVRYAAAIFLSSTLLFLMEPIAGKRLLPLLGGSAAVWTACLVFFQCALLLGYLTAHWLVTRASARMQVVTYVGLLVVSCTQLAIAGTADLHATSAHPITSVLWLLTILIGIPFVTLSATSPLLQAWYARATLRVAGEGAPTEGPHAYRLFAVSNAGSLLALLIYPWLIEPAFSLHGQTTGLTIGLVVLTVVCGTIAYSVRRGAGDRVVPAAPSDARNGAPPDDSIPQRILWVLLAACGSTLLSAVTTHLSQNVATIPLLWIIPLVAYLLSFVVAFSSDRWRPRGIVLGLAALALGGAGYLLHEGDLLTSVPRAVATYCGSLFAICLFCHSELYRRRPAAAKLTTFYFCLAAGGALGAILVGVVAPAVLSGNYELVFGLCFAAALALTVTWSVGWLPRIFWFAATASLAALLATQVRDDRDGARVRLRNFYGSLHVTEREDTMYHAPVRTLYNGIIEHGQQVFRADLSTAPTTYYGHPSGVGLALDLCCGDRPRRIGVIGLGTGTLAAYGRAADVIRFYDINPAVEGIARRYFTYLRDSPARIDVVTGDARVSLEAEAPERYDVLVIDAFSGDAIPVHLITSQALGLYRRHLSPGGIVAFHVSNRYLDLQPVVQQLADHAGMKTALISTVDDDAHDLFGADWVLVTDSEIFLNQPAVAQGRGAITIPRGLRRWTDDYNSLLPVLRMRGEAP